MLKKILFAFTMVGISFLTGYATAQSFFLNKEPTLPKPALASAEVSQNNALPPDEFQIQTQQLGQKKNQALSDQLKQELAKVPPTPPPPSAAPSGTAPEGSAPETSQGQSMTTPPQTPSTPTEQSAPQAAAPSSEAAPAAPPASAPAQSQVYTGFQNSDPNQPAPPANNSNQPASSGGWNIQY